MSNDPYQHKAQDPVHGGKVPHPIVAAREAAAALGIPSGVYVRSIEVEFTPDEPVRAIIVTLPTDKQLAAFRAIEENNDYS